MDPLLSKAMMLLAPESIKSFRIATPAAPAPLSTIFTFERSLFTKRSALMSAARTTIAVPCWSSWKTGISSSSLSRRSTSKHRGAEISSRLMPPYTGAINCTVRTISSTSWVSRHTGHASTSANLLKSAALPSITGRAASGPIFPRPRTAEPSVTTATVLRLIVRRLASDLSAAIAKQIRATPGV